MAKVAEVGKTGKVVAVANQKGGVGKTTTSVNLSAYLALAIRVLLVDLDPQGNATSSLGIDPRTVHPSTYEALIGAAPLPDAIISSGRPNFDLVPASRNLAGAQVELLELPDRNQRLKLALEDVRGLYDVTLIDCPPSLGILTLNGLVAADAVLAPVQCEYLPLEGLGQLVETLTLVRATLNPRLEVMGLLMTMYDARTNLSAQVVDEVRAHFPAETLETVIPRSVRLSEAPSHAKPVLEYDPASRGATAYAELAQELMIRRGLLT